jgi:hypothetical protein
MHRKYVWPLVSKKSNGGNQMIKINERFSIERLDDCWLLVEHKTGINRKTGEETASQKKSWYPRLRHVVDEILDRTPSEAENIQDMALLMRRTRDDIYGALMGTRK